MSDEKPWRNERRLRTLYVEQGLSAREVAIEIDCGKATVLTWLDKYDIPRRQQNSGPWRDEETLYGLYVEKELTTEKIAEELDTTSSTIIRWLDKHNIETRRPNRPEAEVDIDQDRIPENRPWRDEDTLYWLHNEKGIGTTKIANILDCDQTTVRRWVDEYEIKQGQPTYKNDYHLEENWSRSDVAWEKESVLRKLYCEKGIGVREIANILECSPNTVSNWMEKHGIERDGHPEKPDLQKVEQLYTKRDLSGPEIAEKVGYESHSRVYSWLRKQGVESKGQIDYSDAGQQLQDKDLLEELYLDENIGIDRIADRLGCSSITVRRWLNYHDIEIRDRSEALSGELHPRWKGGHVPYGKGWTEKKRKNVRSRDSHRCQACGKTQQECIEKYGVKLHVHHIIPARNVDDPEERNSMNNLVSLCRDCHADWEGIPLKPVLGNSGD